MRAALLFVMLVFSVTCTLAQQFPSERFHFGSVTLNDGQELKGRIKYDLDADVILLIETGQTNVKTLSANQFQSFHIDGGQDRGQRSFYSVPVVNQTGYRRPRIFELIYEGETSLVAREYIATRSRTSSRSSFRRSIYDPFYDPTNSVVTFRYLAYDLWLIDGEAKLSKLGDNRNEVIRAFPNHQSELRKYIKGERLKVDKLQDLTKLIDYYNQLTNL